MSQPLYLWGKEHEVPIEWDDGLVQQLQWMCWSLEECLALLGIESFFMTCVAGILFCYISYAILTSCKGTSLYSPSEISL
jgi:hypothetical protein